MAERLQLSRKRGSRLPADAVSVARPTRWGNPFALRRPFTREDPLRPYLDAGIGDVTGGHVDLMASCHDTVYPVTPAVAVAAYRAWLDDQPDLLAMACTELAGKDLACWCPLPAEGEPDICHAAVLLEAVAKLIRLPQARRLLDLHASCRKGTLT